MWSLDPTFIFLNHGSFGACPAAVLACQARLRERLEAEPVRFFARELPALLDEARAALGAFVGADPDDLGFVNNATTGVNTVLASIHFAPGDEILVTDHGYGACKNAADAVAARTGARRVVAEVPFPIQSPDQVTAAVLGAVTPRTRLALVDHVTSPTGLVFPIEALAAALAARGVDTLIDGAHAPGMLELALDRLGSLGAAYYTGNCHKWLCTPKGSAFLWVRRDRQAGLRPLVISHGATAEHPARSRFRHEFDWAGTDDPTPFLCVPEAISVLGSAVEGGWAALRARNRALAIAGRSVLLGALGGDPPAPESMLGSLAAVPLARPGRADLPRTPPFDPVQDALFHRHRIEVPVFPWRGSASRIIRVSAQLYNRTEDYQALAAALLALLQ